MEVAILPIEQRVSVILGASEGRGTNSTRDGKGASTSEGGASRLGCLL